VQIGPARKDLKMGSPCAVPSHGAVARVPLTSFSSAFLVLMDGRDCPTQLQADLRKRTFSRVEAMKTAVRSYSP